MSTTTQILFNSPALHSLKREQLVKLCKIHSIKASGKNVELIERLKQRAQELPPEAISDLHNADNDAEDMDEDMDYQDGSPYTSSRMARPSEQWEIVMEDIEEENETNGTASSKGTLRGAHGTAGEFGSQNSKKSTVTSSIKALATSLGIKRAPSTKSMVASEQHLLHDQMPPPTDPLTRNAVPYSSLPPSNGPPQTDHFIFSTPEASFLQVPTNGDGDVSLSDPVPGNPSRPGMPAPPDARLSMGAGLTTTIRLINPAPQDFMSPPRLQPYHTAFDLDMGSPNKGVALGQHMTVWPMSPGNNEERLYPPVPLFDEPSLGRSEDQVTGDVSMPGALPTAPALTSSPPRTVSHTPMRPPASAKKETPKVPPMPDVFSPMPESRSATRNGAFLFGSPLPQNKVSNKDFGDAAAAVLEEMNRRLAAAGVGKVDAKVASTESASANSSDVFGTLGAQSGGTQSVQDRFAKAHEEAFSKMDSIATHYAAKRGQPQAQAQPHSKKRKSDVLGHGPAPGAKRKSSAAGARVISNGVRKKMGVPGAFGDDDNDNDHDNATDDNNEDEDAGDRRASKRLRVTDEQGVHRGKRVSMVPPPNSGNATNIGSEEQKKLREREAIRKKLEMNKARRRSSRGRVSMGKGAVAPPPKASRFGFFSTAKSVVRSVWNMGSSNASKATTATNSNAPVTKVSKPMEAKPPVPHLHKPSVPSGSGSKDPSTVTHVPLSSTTSSKLKPDASNSATSAPRSRSPIPTFNAPARPTSSTVNSRMSVQSGVTRPRSGSTSAASSTRLGHTRTSSIPGPSSMGTRTSLASHPTMAVSSLGARRTLSKNSLNSSVNSMDGQNLASARQRTSSLLAPTFSSLAKQSQPVRPGTASSSRRSPGLAAVTEQKSSEASVQSPKVGATSSMTLGPVASNARSPPPGRIFSQPLTNLPRPVEVSNAASKSSFTGSSVMSPPSGSQKPAVPPKPKTLVARKPRISRSRVIAKLGAQRAAGQSSVTATGASVSSSRPRSSAGSRRSLGGVKGARTSGGAEALRSAKKRARQSEFARRKSRATAGMGSNSPLR